MSTYSYYERVQSKKIRDQCLRKLSKKLLKLLRVPEGKLTLGPPPEEFVPTSLFEAGGTQTQYLWWLGLVFV